MDLCSDTADNVFVTSADSPSSGYIYEYAHGGSIPIGTLSDPFGWPHSCSVDPVTGNLAVVDYDDGGINIAIYQGAAGNPTYYTDPYLSYYSFCAYDAKGDLFVDGINSNSQAQLVEMPYGSKTFSNITLNRAIKYLGPLQSLGGHYLAAAAEHVGIYEVKISGESGAVGRLTKAAGLRQQWTIDAGTLISPYGRRGSDVAFWKYPKGGKAFSVLSGFGPGYSLSGVTVSVAPSQ